MNDSHAWITEPAALAAAIARFSGSRRIALDTEANGFHAYRPRLCLIQIAAETADGVDVALIDALAFSCATIAPLRAWLADRAVEKTIHGADYDVRLLARDLDLAIAGLFDTQLAAQLLGLPRSGLAALAEELAGLRLDKAAQRLDWAARPLPEDGLRYAALDVRAVWAIRDVLADRLALAGRRAWADEEFALQEQVRAPELAGEPDPDDLLARATGAGKLSPRQRAVLAEALVWRESEAARRDVPAVHLAPPVSLVTAAARDARTIPELIRAGLPARLAQRHGSQILAAFERGRAAPPRPLARPASTAPPTPAEVEAGARLRDARNRRAQELGLDPGVLCPSSLLKELARGGGADTEALREAGLRAWQVEAVGPALLAALAAAPGSR